MLLLINDYKIYTLNQKKLKNNIKPVSKSETVCEKCTKSSIKEKQQSACLQCKTLQDCFISSFPEIEALKKTKRSNVSPIFVSTGDIFFFEPVPFNKVKKISKKTFLLFQTLFFGRQDLFSS